MSKFVALKKFIKDQDGAALAEYAVALAVITGATITAMQLLGTNIGKVVNSVAGVIQYTP
ncbi:Flp family type IVb pilin [Methylocystis sp. JAN1]|uniref:Flp family type IVb pilin n=1 Tax=Methylocystis sp. JAN1 TaxID=3397211 RepID=UPI003FA2FC7F